MLSQIAKVVLPLLSNCTTAVPVSVPKPVKKLPWIPSRFSLVTSEISLILKSYGYLDNSDSDSVNCSSHIMTHFAVQF